MSRNVDRTGTARQRKKTRRNSLLMVLASIAVVITLLATEQVAILYVIATLAIAALLAVVAMADLRGPRQVAEQPAPYDDAASIGDGGRAGRK